MKKRVAIYIGRFAPLHNGHLETIEYCNKNYDKTLILIGSKNERRTTKNSFSYIRCINTICKFWN